MNPLDSLTKVDKLLLQMKISPTPSPLPSPRNSSSTFDYYKSQNARVVTKKVGDLVKDTAALTKRAVGMAEEETRIKTPAEKKRKTRAKPKPGEREKVKRRSNILFASNLLRLASQLRNLRQLFCRNSRSSKSLWTLF